jgi:hypothetical protein
MTTLRLRESQLRELRKGYADQHLRKVGWSAPLPSRLSSQVYEDQRVFVLDSTVAFFQSKLYRTNLRNYPLPAWFRASSRKRRRHMWRQSQRAAELLELIP